MSHLIVALYGDRGDILLFNESLDCKLEHMSWVDSEGKNHASHLQSNLQDVLNKSSLDSAKLKSLACLSGPSSFTSLRISASFCQAFCSSLNIPFYGFSSYQLLEEDFYIPLRARLAKDLSSEECAQQKLKFLHIRSAVEQEICELPESISQSKLFGLRDSAPFPTLAQIEKAGRWAIENKNTFYINYGHTPVYVKSKA